MSVAKKALVFVAVAALANVATVAVLPRAINALVLHRIAAVAGDNAALPAPRATAQVRTIVRPSPDLLYTACAYDVSARPLHVTGPVPDSYASVSAFAADTRNFFALNDGQVRPQADGSKRFDIVIARDASVPTPGGATLVVAPSTRGLVLFRTLVPREEELPQRLQAQAAQRCEALGEIP